jgi:alkylated DNA repair protein alkB family protein 8
MTPENVQKILAKVKSDYALIAADFNRTRDELWPEIMVLKKYAKPGDKILDLGCGNGRLRLMFKDLDIDYTGTDNSRELLSLARANSDFKLPREDFAEAEMWQLPFADNSFDAIYCIAAFHHLPGRELRLKALKEIKRVLKPGGILVMTNWNRWQYHFLHYIIKYTWLKIIGRHKMDFRDILIPWKNQTERYYHVFTLGELKRLMKVSRLDLRENFLTDRRGKIRSYLTATNIVTIAKKC